MAQTKAKTKSRTKKRAASTSSNGGRATKSRARPSARKTSAKKAAARKSTRTTASRSNSSNRSKSSSSSQNSGDAGLAQKAKGPALATGAVLLGLAGGAAATARNAKRRGPKLPTPNLKRLPRPKSVSLPKSHGSTAAWVGEKAKTLGDAGHRVADMTDQVAKVEKSLRK
jgi:hypothetical protein